MKKLYTMIMAVLLAASSTDNLLLEDTVAVNGTMQTKSASIPIKRFSVTCQ